MSSAMPDFVHHCSALVLHTAISNVFDSLDLLVRCMKATSLQPNMTLHDMTDYHTMTDDYDMAVHTTSNRNSVSAFFLLKNFRRINSIVSFRNMFYFSP